MNLLFVCTGNICRSPMAAALAGRLGLGVRAASAGTAATDGYPATQHAVDVMLELGVDLTVHRSRAFATALASGPSPDRIYALEPSHADFIRRRHPEVADVVQVLCQDGSGIPDPYGRDLATYRTTRDAIEEAVRQRAADWH